MMICLDLRLNLLLNLIKVTSELLKIESVAAALVTIQSPLAG